MQKYNTPEAVTFLTGHLIKEIATTLSLANVTRNLNADQVKTIVRMIIEDTDFRHIKPSEICFYIQNGVAGKYGKLYESIGVDKVFEWIRTGWANRFDELEQYRELEKSKIGNDLSNMLSNMPAEVLTEIKKIAAPKEPEKKEPLPKREKTEEEQLAAEIYNDFAEEVKKPTTEKINEIPFVLYQGRKMNEQEFFNYRWNEIHKEA